MLNLINILAAEAPDDGVARLALADRLEELGDPETAATVRKGGRGSEITLLAMLLYEEGE